jgi:excisionase family DNA binding protein
MRSEELLTEEELRAWLGVSRTTLWRLRKRSNFPFGKIGRTYRYNRADVLEWLSSEAEDGTQLTLNLERKAK